jgi:hypothetical protein
VVDHAAVPLIDGTRAAARAGHLPGGSRRNLQWVLPHTDAGTVGEDDLLLLADAQTSGGLLVAGELPGAPVIGSWSGAATARSSSGSPATARRPGRASATPPRMRRRAHSRQAGPLPPPSGTFPARVPAREAAGVERARRSDHLRIGEPGDALALLLGRCVIRMNAAPDSVRANDAVLGFLLGPARPWGR